MKERELMMMNYDAILKRAKNVINPPKYPKFQQLLENCWKNQVDESMIINLALDILELMQQGTAQEDAAMLFEKTVENKIKKHEMSPQNGCQARDFIVEYGIGTTNFASFIPKSSFLYYNAIEQGHKKAKRFCFDLTSNQILFERWIRHQPIGSCKDSNEIYQRYAYLFEKPIINCKHIVLKEKKGSRIFLIIIDAQKEKIDLQQLRVQLETKKLEFADSNLLQEMLHTYPGNVSIFNLQYDKENLIETIIDQDLQTDAALAFHPLYNGDSIFLPFQSVEAYMKQINHPYQIAHIPLKEEQVRKRVIDTN